MESSPTQPRPSRTVRTPEKEAALLAALRERPSYAAACRKVRISRSLFYEWRNENAEFDRAVIAAREEGLDALEDALVTRGLKSDTTAAIFMLKSLRRDVYGDRIAHTGADGGPISITTVEVVTTGDDA